MILNTKVKSTDVTLLKDTKVIERKGYISINYGNNSIDDNDEICFTSELELEDGLLTLEIKIGFSYKRSCVRCLNISSNNETNELSSKVNIYEENDFEINHDDEYFDLEPIISEMIIDKMQNNFICDVQCKGLCTNCGINLTIESCNCEEKNLKESPFSSLSQLDL
jgi:uncharacterized protein